MKNIFKKKAVLISCMIICILVLGIMGGIAIQSAGKKAKLQSHITAAEKYLSELEYEQIEDERLAESAERVEKEREKHQNEEQKRAEEKLKKEEAESVTGETESSDIEVSEYLTRYEELVSVLEMEKAEAWQFGGTDSYEKDGFQLEYQQQEDIYSMKNTGAEYISLYGIKLGDGIDETVKALKENRWIEFYNHSDQCFYANKIDGKYCGIEISLNPEGKVTKWYLCNWLEGDYTEVFDKIERRDLIENPDFQGWKSAYLFFIENYIEEHKNEEWEIYYEDVIEGTQFSLVYIDDDDVPELIITGMSMADGTDVVTYHNGTVETVHFSWTSPYYLERQGKFYCNYGHMDSYGDEIYEIQNGKFVQIAAGDYGAADNSSVQTDAEGNPIYRYWWNDAEVTKEDYERLLAAAFDMSAAKDSYDSVCYYRELEEQIRNGD